LYFVTRKLSGVFVRFSCTASPNNSLAFWQEIHTIVVRRTNAITCLLSKTITINQPDALS
jgi:hypothetical protein